MGSFFSSLFTDIYYLPKKITITKKLCIHNMFHFGYRMTVKKKICFFTCKTLKANDIWWIIVQRNVTFFALKRRFRWVLLDFGEYKLCWSMANFVRYDILKLTFSRATTYFSNYSRTSYYKLDLHSIKIKREYLMS